MFLTGCYLYFWSSIQIKKRESTVIYAITVITGQCKNLDRFQSSIDTEKKAWGTYLKLRWNRKVLAFLHFRIFMHKHSVFWNKRYSVQQQAPVRQVRIGKMNSILGKFCCTHLLNMPVGVNLFPHKIAGTNNSASILVVTILVVLQSCFWLGG